MATSPSAALDDDLGIDACIEEMERLVRSGVHPDRISLYHDASAVQWACQAQWVYYDGPDEASAARRVDAQFALLRLMLEHGANPNKRKNRNSTPLAVCCRQFISYFQERAVERLALVLAAGGDPRQTKDPAICMALGLGEMRGEIFDMAFRADAPAGHADAVFQAIDLLLKAGADIEAMDHRQMYTPLLMAAFMGSVPLMQFLKERGANVHATNPDGSNALMYTAGDVDGLANSRAGFSTTWHRRGDPVATTRQLIDWGLDPAAANARGRTPLRLAVNAGNLDVAAVLAEALASQGKLGAAEVRLFKGTEYQARVAALTTSVQPKKPAKPKKPIKPKASEDVVQRATWDRALALIDGPTDWQPSQYPEWLRTCLKEVIARLASGADPRVPPDVLYLEYHGHFRSLRWSRTKSYVSRSGAVELEAQVFDWAKMSVSFSQVDNDNWVLREAIELPMEPPGTPPSTEALCDAVGQLCAKYLKTVG